MKIMPNRLDRGFQLYQEEFETKALEVLRSGWYVLGKEVSSFEEEFAAYTGGKHCIGLARLLFAAGLFWLSVPKSRSRNICRIWQQDRNWEHLV